MKKIFALFMVMVILLMLVPNTAFASKAEESVRLITQEDYAQVEAMWLELNAVEARVTKDAVNTETIATVASAAMEHPLYVSGTLRWNGEDQFTFETTVGVTCGYSARLRNIARNAKPGRAPAEAETQVISYAKKNAPHGKDVYLIEPYYQIDSSFTKQYQNEGKAIAEATGGLYHLYTKTAATIDAVATAVESGAVVIFDSHGDTNFARGDDYTSGATTSYLLLQTGSGLTDADYADDKGIYHAVYYGSYGSMKYYAVDGTCIANHMDVKAPHSLLWMAICLGMATNGLHAPLRANGVEVAYGYSQSVTFDYDYLWEETFFDEMIAGNTVANAIATMKKEVGEWDYCDYYDTIYWARQYDCAFPIVVSSEDVYPGHGNVDALQNVYSTWKLYANEVCMHTSTTQNMIEPTCELEGSLQTICTNCGALVASEVLPALGHNAAITTTEPTCTQPGSIMTYCDRCHLTFSLESIPALGHNTVTQTVAPTCTQEGVTMTYCDRCGMIFSTTDTIPALGHDYVMSVVEPTCESDGGELYVCTRCGDNYLENVIPRIGHEFVDEICINCGCACLCELYSDVDTSDWFHDAVVYAHANQLMNGIGDGLFDPEGELTRAMLVTILYRAVGYPSIDELPNPFVDVKEGQWYYDAVVWAYSVGVVNGVSATEFAPNVSITREQIATILYRFAGSPNVTDLIVDFVDGIDVSDYAIKAILWAIQFGIINGMDGLLAPQKTATRAQAATILMRYLQMN